MSARFIVSDVFDGLAALRDEGVTVDLVMTSPPFLCLRSYLPSDHPDKAKEIGSEPTPADFIDTMLDVVEACASILAPHGSICFELGDSFAGSGGAGGDYADDGWRSGQQKWGGSASRSRESKWDFSEAKWLAGVIDTEGSIQVRKVRNGTDKTPSYMPCVSVTMMDREVCDRAALISGVGETYFDQKRRSYTWAVSAQQARYVLLHIWPFLLIKQKQAKAGIELARHVEDSQRRGQYGRVSDEMIRYRELIREHVQGWNRRGDERGTFVATWEPPTPKRMTLKSGGGPAWPNDKSLCMIPSLFAASLAYGRNLLRPERETEPWRVRNLVAWVRPNPPVGALGDKVRPATSYLTWATKARDRWFDLDAVRVVTPTSHETRQVTEKNADPRRGGTDTGNAGKTIAPNPAGAPPLDWWCIPPGGYNGSHYAVYPAELCRIPIEASCPRRVCRTCGVPSRRIGGSVTLDAYRGSDRPQTVRAVELADAAGLTDEHIAAVRATGPNDTGKALHVNNGAGKNSDEVKRLAAEAKDVLGGYFREFVTTGNAASPTTGWTTCGCPGTDGIRLDGFHDGNGWRPGIVLDPFAGSGTTLLAASGRSRDSIGIDLDERNADLARERLGMFLTVDELPPRPVVEVAL